MTNREVAAIRRRIDNIVEAIHARKLADLKQLYTADVVSFDVEPPLQHEGIEAKLANWSHAFSVFENANYEVRDLTVEVSGDVAIGHAFARISGTLRNGSVTDGMWVRVSYGFRKVDGAWLIAHDHVSVPLDIASGNGIVDLEPEPGTEGIRS